MQKADSLPQQADLLSLIPGYDPFATAEWDHYFDAKAAARAVDFFPACLTHIEGALAGKPFVLEPWQKSIIANLFGWKRGDGTRRYREAFIFVPRKNGKTPMAAGIALYTLFCDGEKGQQDYCAAAEREQAALVFRHAKGMVENEPELSRRCKIFGGLGQRSITIENEGSFLKVLSADADTKHGGNSHLVIIDELHAQPNRDLVDVLQTSMASKNRRQPLMIYITTSDFDRPSICNEKQDYAEKVRDGVINDAAFLPVVFKAAAGDDWRTVETWKKANPNYGVSVSEEYFKRECERAQNEPTYENTFKRLHLNIRTEQDVRWIQLDAWDKCGAVKFTAEELAGELCNGGLDLSSTTDIAALNLFFPNCKRTISFFWVPRDRAEAREKRDRAPYLTWARQGLIELTPGNVIDYQFIRRRLAEIKNKFNIQRVAYDPWNATQFALQLKDQDGFDMVEFRQGYVSMNEPCKQIERMVMGGELQHGGNPVLRWMAGNVTATTDAAGNIKMDKAKSTEKIDGMVALAEAVGISLEGAGVSIYETKGITVIG